MNGEPTSRLRHAHSVKYVIDVRASPWNLIGSRRQSRLSRSVGRIGEGEVRRRSYHFDLRGRHVLVGSCNQKGETRDFAALFGDHAAWFEARIEPFSPESV